MFEENKSSEGKRLNFRVEVSNISQKVDSVSKIGKTSVVESLSFTSNNVSSVGSSLEICGKNEGFTNNKRDKSGDGLLENCSLRGVSAENIQCGLKGRLSGNSCARSSGWCGKSSGGETVTSSEGEGIRKLAITSLTSLDSSSKDVLELVNL